MQLMSPSGQLLGWFFGKTMVSADAQSVRLLGLTAEPSTATGIVTEAIHLDLPLRTAQFWRQGEAKASLEPTSGLALRQAGSRSYAIAKALPKDFWTLFDAVEFREDLFA